jgi:hypothetical protein
LRMMVTSGKSTEIPVISFRRTDNIHLTAAEHNHDIAIGQLTLCGVRHSISVLKDSQSSATAKSYFTGKGNRK